MNEEIETEAVESAAPEVQMRILRIGKCESLSQRSELQYLLGVSPSGSLMMCLHSNTGRGLFSKSWIDMEAIARILDAATPECPVTSKTLHVLAQGRSINNQSFMAAALQNESWLCKSQSLRSFDVLDRTQWHAGIRSLMATDISLDAQGKPGRQTPRLAPASAGNEASKAAKAAGKASGKGGAKSKKA